MRSLAAPVRLIPIALALGQTWAPAGELTPLVEPRVVASRDGRLAVDLTAAPGRFAIGGESFEGMLYGGSYVPPVWRVEPGDTLAVRLHNGLAEVTNLHFHGLHVSPVGHGDNVFVHVDPGASFDYEITIPPDHDPGLYWFHTHAHGFVSRQVIAGLSGAIVVGGIERRYPMLRGMRERLLLLKHIPHPRADWEELVTLNGQVSPAIDIHPGEAQLWRIGNIGADLFLRLSFQALPAYIIGTDGHPLTHPTRAGEILLGPGQRVELVVVGPPAGRYPLRSVPLILEEGKPPLPEHVLGVVVSSGPVQDAATVERRIEAAVAPPSRALTTLRTAAIGTRRTFVFTRSMDRMHFYINGKLFGEAGTTLTVPLGSVEEWTIRNEDNQLHNFHLHQTPFLVTDVDGVAQPADRLFDTIPVSSRVNGRPGSVRLKVAFTDPVIVGRFVFHCHVAKHEDKGMMQTIVVERAD
jgi:FtsP/CotA-like multicopper oxidase with cupredoxin domain